MMHPVKSVFFFQKVLPLWLDWASCDIPVARVTQFFFLKKENNRINKHVNRLRCYVNRVNQSSLPWRWKTLAFIFFLVPNLIQFESKMYKMWNDNCSVPPRRGAQMMAGHRGAWRVSEWWSGYSVTGLPVWSLHRGSPLSGHPSFGGWKVHLLFRQCVPLTSHSDSPAFLVSQPTDRPHTVCSLLLVLPRRLRHEDQKKSSMTPSTCFPHFLSRGSRIPPSVSVLYSRLVVETRAESGVSTFGKTTWKTEWRKDAPVEILLRREILWQ